MKLSLHCEESFFQQLLFITLILQDSTDSRLAVCQSVIYWDRASNTCFLHSSFPAPVCEIPQLQTSFAHYTALNGQALKSSNTKRAGTITTALVFEKTSSSKHTRNNLASPSAFSFKTPVAKPASEICKICTCQTGNVQM